MIVLRGKCSWFGGPNDMGVAPDEGLAFIYDVTEAPHLFLPEQPPGTTGLARRLDPNVFYIACRWDYSVTPKKMLPDMPVVVVAPSTGRQFAAYPADWGPNEATGRVADLSPALLAALELQTDDEVEVYYDEEVRPMIYSKIAISSGHSSKCPGAVGIVEEVEEARLVVDAVALELMSRNVLVNVFHDDISDDQSENLNRICNWHNTQDRELDISVHFNASDSHEGHGVEVLYVTQEDLARRLSTAIADAGQLADRGPKYRSDLAFLNNTSKPAVLIEVCFCDNATDVGLYEHYFDDICSAIADVLGGPPPEEAVVPPDEALGPFIRMAIEVPEGTRMVIQVNDVYIEYPPKDPPLEEG